MVGYTLRLTPEQLEAMKRLHRETYPSHGLSFNAWAVARIIGTIN